MVPCVRAVRKGLFLPPKKKGNKIIQNADPEENGKKWEEVFFKL